MLNPIYENLPYFNYGRIHLLRRLMIDIIPLLKENSFGMGQNHFGHGEFAKTDDKHEHRVLDKPNQSLERNLLILNGCEIRNRKSFYKRGDL